MNIDRNFPNVDKNMNILAIEIREVPKKIVVDQTTFKTPIKKQRRKRINKLSDNEKMIEKFANIPHVEKILQQLKLSLEAHKKQIDPRGPRKLRKPLQNENPLKVTIHEVEKHNVSDETNNETPLIQLQRKRTRNVKRENIMLYPMEKKIK